MSTIIAKKLYLGNILNANRLQWMNQMNINTIICVATKNDVIIKKEIHDAKQVYQYELEDNISQVINFDEIIEQIESAFQYGAVLINCAAGISRSAAVTIAYLMKTQNKSLDEAYIMVKRARQKISPNPFFIEQLQCYEKLIFRLNK